ncbi:NADH dehydrogenase (Ubiquinone), 30 kDa subunit [uncultured Pleomorphomonas sp.]|uniref:NADH dehydrogenase (Ubiquinone), 30 kDa subunit n=1 Tax=uncultured Pleomorphomonas sp. TaxID=442121 RepID=A0A212LF22_9HYPH|nr:NADH-quinone oxidoreductase subunit C [uncultured Pleomorphomonas sp.]SCM76161.1 NADH dehydrogenase (Ubiquinone), 30 kDa subunit [uncultured Pleomorphomonas sp.]
MTTPTSNAEILLATTNTLPGTVEAHPEPNGLITIWVRLADRSTLAAGCRSLKAVGARLSMITAMPDVADPGHFIAYHFDVSGSTVTLTVRVGPGETVETIVPIFRNADWHEREFVELYGIGMTGRMSMRTLFLDEESAGRRRSELIPLSRIANAASTKDLWEQLEAAKEAQ